MGYNTVGINYLGDWGKQYGKEWNDKYNTAPDVFYTQVFWQ
jgi:arginyl-tRNA synthetase